MIRCGTCGWSIPEESTPRPCPGCGEMIRFLISTDMGTAFEASRPAIPISAYRWAPAWFEDALSEARGANGRNARRREIVFAVCCVEGYLLEWIFHDMLDGDRGRLLTYF